MLHSEFEVQRDPIQFGRMQSTEIFIEVYFTTVGQKDLP